MKLLVDTGAGDVRLAKHLFEFGRFLHRERHPQPQRALRVLLKAQDLADRTNSKISAREALAIHNAVGAVYHDLGDTAAAAVAFGRAAQVGRRAAEASAAAGASEGVGQNVRL